MQSRRAEARGRGPERRAAAMPGSDRRNGSMERPLFARARALAQLRFGAAGRLFHASGRVNLLGAHVDYHGGCVLPVAVDRGIAVCAVVRREPTLRLVSAEFEASFEAPLAALPEEPPADWTRYPLGVVRALLAGGCAVPGLDLAVAGDVPPGAGMSSSAALLVATALAVAACSGRPLAPLEAARLAHRVETGWVGVRCGIMDPFASALARPGHALWLDCKDESFEHVALPAASLAFVMLDSGTRRALADGRYNACVAESKGAFQKLRARLPGVDCLRDVTAAQLDAQRDALDEREFKRARHVVTEVARARHGRELLARGELIEFGQLLWLSHHSSRFDYEVSTPRLDVLHELAIAQPGCYGARLTGAGFGGCALALVRPEALEGFCERVAAGFAQRFGERPELHRLGSGEAAGEVGAPAPGAAAGPLAR